MQGDKKIAIIAILKILEDKTDANHPITYEKIGNLLLDDYNITMERRAIARNIGFLRDYGYDIEVGHNGTYINSREFDDSELKLLIDNVVSNKYITAAQSKDLAEKLMAQASQQLRKHTKYVTSMNDWNKTTNQEVFLNIEIIDEAIAEKKQIEFDYNEYNTDHQLVPRHAERKSVVSPYRRVVKNQRYYLMCKNMYHGSLTYYKIDKMTNMKKLDVYADDINTLPSFTHGVNNSILSDALPYMFSDKPENIQLELNGPYAADVVWDWFGSKVKFTKGKDDKTIACLKSSKLAMKYWALQFYDVVKVISPIDLVEDIKKALSDAVNMYNN